MVKHSSSILLLVVLGIVAGCEPRAKPVPGATMADLTLQSDVTKYIMLVEKGRAPSCATPKIASTAVLQKTADGHASKELWTVDRCGTPISYQITYIPDGQGGTYFVVSEAH
jgi:hypothetical protein